MHNPAFRMLVVYIFVYHNSQAILISVKAYAGVCSEGMLGMLGRGVNSLSLVLIPFLMK